MYNTERSVEECRIRKLGDSLTTTKSSKTNITNLTIRDSL